MSSSSAKNIKVTRLLEDLNSGIESKVSAAIKSLQSNGNLSVIEPMVILLTKEITTNNRKEIIEFLSTLNVSDAIEEIMRILKHEKYLTLRPLLLTTIWNSKLDYSFFLADFVEIAVDGTFMETLECLTILENMEGPFEERHILEAQLHLRDYLEADDKNKDERKASLISEIALLIKDFNEMDDDDISIYE